MLKKIQLNFLQRTRSRARYFFTMFFFFLQPKKTHLKQTITMRQQQNSSYIFTYVHIIVFSVLFSWYFPKIQVCIRHIWHPTPIQNKHILCCAMCIWPFWEKGLQKCAGGTLFTKIGYAYQWSPISGKNWNVNRHALSKGSNVTFLACYKMWFCRKLIKKAKSNSSSTIKIWLFLCNIAPKSRSF